MSEEQTTEGTGQEAGTENGGEQQNSGPEKTTDWYEKELTKTRNEAAKYRTQLRETETKLTGLKTPEEFETATKSLAEANKKLERELLVERVGKGLPPELVELLKGDTEEELKAHAEVLKKFVPATDKVEEEKKNKPPRKLGGGLNGKDDVDDFDPVKIATQVRTGKL